MGKRTSMGRVVRARCSWGQAELLGSWRGASPSEPGGSPVDCARPSCRCNRSERAAAWLVLATMAAASIARAEEPDYYPLDVGNRWEYRLYGVITNSTIPGYGQVTVGGTWTETVVGRRTVQGVEYMELVGDRAAERNLNEDTLCVRKDGPRVLAWHAGREFVFLDFSIVPDEWVLLDEPFYHVVMREAPGPVFGKSFRRFYEPFAALPEPILLQLLSPDIHVFGTYFAGLGPAIWVTSTIWQAIVYVLQSAHVGGQPYSFPSPVTVVEHIPWGLVKKPH
jgi:hypothetical protein